MGKTFKIIVLVLLLTAANCFPQSTKLNLNEIHSSYLKSNPDSISNVLIGYLVKQYYILEEFEKRGLVSPESMSKTEISELESQAYKFLDNRENFDKLNFDFEEKIPENKLNQFSNINFLLLSNYEVFARFLNNSVDRKDFYKEFKNNNNICKDLLTKLIHDFQK